MALHENPDPCFNGFQLSSSVELRGDVNVEGFQNESKIRVAHASFPVNTGKPEGFNNKIKVAKRNACGFRNLSFLLLYQIPFNSQNLFLNPKKNMKNLLLCFRVSYRTSPEEEISFVKSRCLARRR